MSGGGLAPDRPVYEVFARRLREEPLRHIGSVKAPTPALARAYARFVYDEEDWIEMYVVARRDLLPVTEIAPRQAAPAVPA